MSYYWVLALLFCSQLASCSRGVRSTAADVRFWFDLGLGFNIASLVVVVGQLSEWLVVRWIMETLGSEYRGVKGERLLCA